jgi:hypothetical protein
MAPGGLPPGARPCTHTHNVLHKVCVCAHAHVRLTRKLCCVCCVCCVCCTLCGMGFAVLIVVLVLLWWLPLRRPRKSSHSSCTQH